MSHLILALLLLGSGADEPPAKPADRVICKQFDVTGSLVRKKKVCRTKAEWAKADSELNQAMNRFVEERRGRPASGN